MRILAIDTATEACSVCLRHGAETRQRLTVEPRRHAELLLGWVGELLAEGGCALADLDAIAVSHGPGSFTGVRIGFAAAQGLAFGADLGIVGVSTLAALAETVRREHGAESVVAALDARMDEVYLGAYRYATQPDGGTWRRVLADQVAAPADLAQLPGAWTLAGHGAIACSGALASRIQTVSAVRGDALPDALAVAQLAVAALAAGVDPLAPEHAQPVYLRDRVARKPV